MKTDTRKLGGFGEGITVSYLERRGYSIFHRNYSKKFGELDLIAIDPEGTLVFVEVKTMLNKSDGIKPEDQLTTAKLKKLQRISQFFINEHPELVDEEKGWRIDLVAVSLDRGGSGKWQAKIRHYKGIS